MGTRLKFYKREADLAKTAEMYFHGKTQAFIAQEMGVNTGTVCRRLQVLRKRWQESSLNDTDGAMSRELAKIDNLEREYWEAWLKSRETTEQTTKEKREGTEPYSKVSVRSEPTPGNPQFLEGVRWCIEQRGKLLGLYAPVKQDVVIHDFSNLTDEELAAEILREAEGITSGAAAPAGSESGGREA